MKFLKNLFLLNFITAILILQSCSDSSSDPVGDDIQKDFESEELAKLFVENCATELCHSGTNPQQNLSLESHSRLIEGSFDRNSNGVQKIGGEVVIPFYPEKSILYKMITGESQPRMPYNLPALTNENIELVRNWIASGAKNKNGEIPFSRIPSHRVYICNQGSDFVSVVDGDAKVVSRLINVDQIDEVDSPHMVQESGDYFYVTLITTGKLLKISKSTLSIVGEIAGIEKAGMIKITSDGTKAYVSRSSTSPSVYSTVYYVDLNSMSILKEIDLVVTGVPHGIALTPDGSKLYAANLTKNVISIVNTATNETESFINFAENIEPMQTEISPDGKYLFVAARGTSELIIIDAAADTVTQRVEVKPMPMHISVNSTSDKIYVTSMGANVLMVIEKIGNQWILTNEISHPAFSQLHGCDITFDDKYVYVSGRNTNGKHVSSRQTPGSNPPGILGVINAETNKVIKVLEIEHYAAGLTIDENPKLLEN
ncbi:MAG: YncE family protein [Melioribacteraceae bacterium]|nr:YncE family protein [Melioribacteraceae bacterium]MDD3558985.1 YncE family protein [Melioribacteraceae bacterium]